MGRVRSAQSHTIRIGGRVLVDYVTELVPSERVRATFSLPPVDPYVAVAGYNMLVQVTYRRVARYASDTWLDELFVPVNASGVLTAVKAATNMSFASGWLKAVQGGTAPTTSVSIDCNLSIIRIGSGADSGHLSITMGATFSGAEVSISGVNPYIHIKQTPLGAFGPLVFEVTAPLVTSTDQAHATATVSADLANSTLSIDQQSSTPDALWFSGTQPGKAVFAAIVGAVQGAGSVDLFPPLSPFGAMTGSNVFETFEADVFPTANPPYAAAGLSVGFQLRTASVGSPADVQSIEGFDDYGTIMDQWTVERVLENRWAHGGFLQALAYDATGKIDLQDGNGPQDVELWGTVDLTSLDQVTIETGQSDDGELDVLNLGGSCEITIDQIKTLGNGDEQTLDKDNTFPSDWSFAAGIYTSQHTPTQPIPPAAQAFIDYASSKTIQYLARPLRGVTQTVTTAALDGVAGYLYATGRF